MDKSTQRTVWRRSLDKTLFFLFTAIPIASDRQAVAQGAQSDSNKSTLLPIYKQISDNNKQERRSKKKKQEEQRLATINILEKTSEVKKGVHSAFLIVNSVSTSSWTR